MGRLEEEKNKKKKGGKGFGKGGGTVSMYSPLVALGGMVSFERPGGLKRGGVELRGAFFWL